jgi:copper chaperone
MAVVHEPQFVSAAQPETGSRIWSTGGKMREVTLRIENMHCGACVRRVTQALEKLDGVRVGEVRVGAARVDAPDNVQDAALLGAIDKAGYPAIVEH